MIRKAVLEDLDGILLCIRDAKAFLKASGSSQWNNPNDDYPNRDILKNDILNGNCYIIYENNEVACVSVYQGYEEDYENIVEGNWLIDTDNYLTVHRVAVLNKYRGCGYAKMLIQNAFLVAKKRNCLSVRIDTHEKNLVMQKLVKSLGFTNCGVVRYRRIAIEPERIIYEKLVK